MMSELEDNINNQALRAFRILSNDKEADKEKVIECLQIFNSYLSDLSSRISKKKLSESHVINWIFKTDFDKKDIKSFHRANIEAAKDSLERTIEEIVNKEINEVTRRMLIDFICDLKPFINQFDATQNYSWLVTNTDTHITNFYFSLANSFFWNGAPGTHEEEYRVLASSTPLIIRQSLEYKIKRVLGIQYIRKNGKIHQTRLSDYFDAFKNSITNFRLQGINIAAIEKIHSWSHYYVHSGRRPEPWRTETALHYVNKLNFVGNTSKKNMYSIFASIEVDYENLVKIKSDTEKFFKKKLGDNILIQWENPEVAIIKSNKRS